ncbi:sugar phosphate nucleotidyltransferase [Halobaculum lipolyticum]|uniref:Bifunctional protein GlmU n=1 Tax=Halobaculum lipolyticum TaxID=3032001 RepID=A0ABD5W6N1_9EURY|nr:sugar phosphate nucleotidyltransferase [Halobaculum sp. DT31]
MKAVLLAAGGGRRLGPLTERRPKPMVPVGNRPILETVLEAAVGVGVEEVVLVVGRGSDRIRTHFGDGDEWGVEIRYVVQDHQLGAAHALSQVESVVDGHFLTLHGDQLVDEELLERLVARWEETATPTIAAVRSQRPTEYGAVEIEDGTVRGVSRTPTDDPPFLVNGGAYVFDERVFDVIRGMEETDDGDFGMATALQRLADGGGLAAVLHRGAWQDLTYPWDLLTTNAALVHEHEATGASDHPGVHDTAAVSEAVALDEGVSIGPNATLLPGTSLGRNVRVGANAVVSNSIVMAGAHIGDGAVVHDTVVGEAAAIGSNVTAEGGPADVEIDDRIHRDVGLGGVVADRATIRGNATLTPGTVVGCEVVADSGTVLQGRIASEETVRRA